ncbi:hypothetical protein IFM89_029037 [Coptis chinensis]|uniref:Calmodulin-binding domain-containing protein n=1 Tax=Coptis chinensis TaxID=261450 RepID=A0A835IEC6_9MAGN|nr:hypothetical protein IFM89_029037 [Coptis chinensis]
MATTAKDASHGKEKARSPSSATQHNTTTQGRKTLKPFVAGSTASRGLAIITDKPSPHYLRPTVSSAKDACKNVKKQASDDTSLKYSHTRRKSIEKPPSPSQLKRTLSAGQRGRTLIPSSPPAKKDASPKPVSDRSTPKTPKSGKAQQFARPVTIRKSTSPITKYKKESKPTISNATTPTSIPTSPDTAKAPSIRSEDEEKVAPVQEVQAETIEVAEEGAQIETLPTDDHISIDPTDSEHKIPDSCDSSMLSEEHELVTDAPIEGSKEQSGEVVDEENKPKNDEQFNNIENNCQQLEERTKVEEKEEEMGEDGTSEKKEITKHNAASTEDSGDEDKPHKLKFRKAREIDEKEVEDGGIQRLKFKERKEDVESNEAVKAEAENVTLKRQDVQEKKESVAYNVVIEETASKLVGKRKSKVKALVGAFETVINLENDTQQTEGE